jgi:hypothetical protein
MDVVIHETPQNAEGFRVFQATSPRKARNHASLRASVVGTKICTEFKIHVWQTIDAFSDSSKSIQMGGRTDGCIPATKPSHES